ncbi:hypothetical protein EPUL_002605 [Erysiphe pulchra]|uniref:Uncharacterized protein n=1 Tax=Erysiphe pulchra TaxID=225359 RepID=A0A2S4PVE3_9PEZI|nr:hypothetical protein EPUL_002605 [Erysiphe pulchra]
MEPFSGVNSSCRILVNCHHQPWPLKNVRRVHLNLRRKNPSVSYPDILRYRGDLKYFSTDQNSQNASNLYPVESNFQHKIQDLQSTYTQLSCQTVLPSEGEVEVFLRGCLNVAQSLSLNVSSSVSCKAEAASTLLTLNHSKSKHKVCQTSPEVEHIIQSTSELAFSIIKHPNVFISPKLLKLYVAVQAALGWPDTLPEVFYLYSHKPVPLRNTSPIRYSKPKPNLFTNAIPQDIAKAALETAYTGKAYKSSRFVRQALLPISLLTITPFAIYTLASQLSNWQTSMDAHTARNVAFLGMMAYLGLTGTVGFIAISTSNDHMNRVTWAPGVPLRQRWIREDERAAIDQVASAWGFRESWRRGDEEGEEWDLIKEWVSRRAMILDRVELMEGMN